MMDERIVNLMEQLEPEMVIALDGELEGWRDMTLEEFREAYLTAMDGMLDLYHDLGEEHDDD